MNPCVSHENVFVIIHVKFLPFCRPIVFSQTQRVKIVGKQEPDKLCLLGFNSSNLRDYLIKLRPELFAFKS